MATITTGSHPKQLWPGIKKISGDTYKEVPLMAAEIFQNISSDKSYEEYLEETGTGYAAIKPEGDAIQYDSDAQGYTTRLVNQVIALGGKVTMEAIQDGQYGNRATKVAKKLARSVRHSKEAIAANIFNRAFNSSYTGGDGVEMISTAHPTVNGTQSNELTVAADFSEAALEDLMIQIDGETDSRGLRTSNMAKCLVVPSDLRFEAQRVLYSDLQAGTGNNDLNAMKSLGVLPDGVKVWRFLTDDDAWFLVTQTETGLLMQNRMAYTFDQDNDFDTRNACMVGMERFAFGWHDWRGVYGSPGAA